jgi:hypothetical protein
MDTSLPVESIQDKILLLRGQKVMLDEDLAGLYGVETRRLNEQVRRNIKRFPPDFMFQLNEIEFTEAAALRSRFVTLKKGRGQHRKYLPFAFTEQGIAMLSSVLNSDRAIEMNILIMRAFVNLREMISSHKDLVRKLDELEMKYDAQFAMVFDAMRELIAPVEPKKRKIGYIREEQEENTA